MALATLQVSIIPKRMLTQTEAAHHCGRSLARFKIECPVPPVVFANGDRRWDVEDLDAWLNSLKGAESASIDSILARLE